MLKRLIVVPFVNVFCSPTDRVPFDPTNPQHRMKDPHLREKMATPKAKEQLLVWLVKGAVQWYKQGDLGQTPGVLRESLQEYINDNDVLHQFIQEECQVDCKGSINAADFRARFVQASAQKISQKLLQEMMTKRGFKLKMLKDNGKTVRAYHGLTLISTTSST